MLSSWVPFLERPGNLTGQKSYFEIKFRRKSIFVVFGERGKLNGIAISFRAPAYIKGDTMIVGGISVCLRFARINLLASIDRGSLEKAVQDFNEK